MNPLLEKAQNRLEKADLKVKEIRETIQGFEVQYERAMGEYTMALDMISDISDYLKGAKATSVITSSFNIQHDER